MKAGILYKTRDIRIKDIKNPKIGTDEVLIRVKEAVPQPPSFYHLTPYF
ncbi:MAG: hypothetical protein ABH873_09460 [Candidatus Firestonebacteria bacterium]